MKRHRHFVKRSVVFIAVVTMVAALSTTDVNASDGPTPPRVAEARSDVQEASGDQSGLDSDAAIAMAAEQGISVAEAKRRLSRQEELGERGARIVKALAGRSGGIYLDDDGQLVVTTLDATGDAAARRGGARAQRVDDSSARLDLIMSYLDQLASKGSVRSLHDWYVDVPTNTVVVTVVGASDPDTRAFLRGATSFGNSVRINRRPASDAPRATPELMGGLKICSTARRLLFDRVQHRHQHREPRRSHRRPLPAADRKRVPQRLHHRQGSHRELPRGRFRHFLERISAYWRPVPAVYKYNNTRVNVRGVANPPVGTRLCKSGATTGYTCGKITAKNQTVIYDGRDTMRGLVRRPDRHLHDGGRRAVETLRIVGGRPLPERSRCGQFDERPRPTDHLCAVELRGVVPPPTKDPHGGCRGNSEKREVHPNRGCRRDHGQ